MRRLSVVALVVSCIFAAAASADQPDPAAPPGASANWLPMDRWVLDHWLPYDAGTLTQALGVDFADLPSLIDDGTDVSLAEVARERGLRPHALLRELMAPWRGRVSHRRFQILRQRAALTFSQPHLAHHMFGHTFHVASLNKAVDSLYGVSLPALNQLRREGKSYYEIGEMNGVARPQLLAAETAILRGTLRTAVKHHQTPRAWAKFWGGYQLERLSHYLDYEPGAAAKSAPRMLCSIGL